MLLASLNTSLNILYELQHGFLEKRSCETQLIILIDGLSKTKQLGKQTGLILLDFGKAFDKVAHEKLIQKLHHYGIRGDTLKWIKDFLDNGKQTVVINGVNSNCILVSSGVPQGSGPSPILFLIFIIDLPEQVKSSLRLFADNTATCLVLSSHIAALKNGKRCEI